MASGMLRQSRWTILLSINAAAILIAGILISSAIWFNGGIEFRVVGERSDIIADETGEMELLESVSDSDSEIVIEDQDLSDYDYILSSDYIFDSTEVPAGELWNESSIVIYATPNTDICVGGGLSDWLL